MAKQVSGLAILGAVVLGGVIGATAGILFAPASGEETRKILKIKAKAISNDLSKKALDLSKDVQKRAKDFNEDTLEPLTKKVGAELKDFRKTAKKTATRLVKKL